MAAYEHVVVLVSFIVSLGFAHILVGLSGLVQSPAKVKLALPHALWVLVAAGCLLDLWLGMFELKDKAHWSIGEILLIVATSVVGYLTASFAMPASFVLEGVVDLADFHQKHRRAYIAAFIVYIVLDIATALTAYGVTLSGIAWLLMVFVLLVIIGPAVAALFINRRWVQIAAPAFLVVLLALYWLTVDTNL